MEDPSFLQTALTPGRFRDRSIEIRHRRLLRLMERALDPGHRMLAAWFCSPIAKLADRQSSPADCPALDRNSIRAWPIQLSCRWSPVAP